jgi:prephenate dehydrogenase
MAARHRALAGHVVGYVRRSASVEESLRRGAVDRATLDLAEAVTDADLLVLCTPIGDMRPLLERMRPWLKPGAVVTDVGSVKAAVVRELEPVAAEAGARFVGSHPMAGAEKTGAANARRDLFVNRACAVTPTPQTAPDALDLVQRLWESVGGKPLQFSPEVHDELVSRSSHLPHMVAAHLVNYVLTPARGEQQELLCGSGFRDSTRIASGSPEMWRDIALANHNHLAKALAEFTHELNRLVKALEQQDSAALLGFLANAKERRDDWLRTLQNLAED